MSAQTGRQSIPPPPSSTRLELATYKASRWWESPNPVWMRELKQAARLTRTPVILATLTGLLALLMCAIGGLMSVRVEPARVGVALFHTYFSVAFFVVTWVGPAVAAATIASERSGRTWYALLLTGLGPDMIARGKFLASLTYIGLYIVMLAPVGALPFLFGGVSAVEVFTAFLFLGLIAVLSVAFGLSVSSKFSSSAVAIVVTLIVAFPLSIFLFVMGGPVLSEAVHDLWPAVPDGPPVWLPTAYVRGDFGLEYIAFLIVMPLAVVALPAWFFYEITVANMRSPSDDRSTGLRRWFLVAAPCFTVAAVFPAFTLHDDQAPAVVIGMCAMLLFLVIQANIFAGEPIGPSRRVRIHWEREGTTRLLRFLGPGIMRASTLLLIFGLGSLLLMTVCGVALEVFDDSWPKPRKDVYALAIFSGYACCFFVFVVGLTAWLRARAQAPGGPRVLQLAIIFGIMLGPWVIAAIAGVLAQDESAMVVASPSPAYVVVMIEQGVFRRGPDSELSLVAGACCALAWALVGLGLLNAARVKTHRIVADHDAAQNELDEVLRQEDGAEVPAAPSPAPQEGA